MKRIGVFSTFLLFAFLGATAFAQTQQDQQGDKQGKREERARPEKQQQPQQPAQQQRQRPDRAQQQPQQPVQLQPQQPQQPQRAQQQPQLPAQAERQRTRRAQQQPQQPAQVQPQLPQRAQQQPQQPTQVERQRPQRAQQQPQQPTQVERQRPQRAQQQPAPQLPAQVQPQRSERAHQQPQLPAQVQEQERRTTQLAQLRSTPEQQRVWQQEQHRTWQQHRARNFDSDHRSWQQRGGYNGYRIPDNDFHSYYGRDHWFRVFSLPFLVVGGAPRFQYGGYWFSPVEAYPEYWGYNWYETDDVYVDYINDGYYLFNRRFPDRPGVAISISFEQDHYPAYYRDQIPAGSYAQTCQNIRVSGDTLYATCAMINLIGWRDTALRHFDQCVGEITNVNGELQCIGSSFQPYQYPNQYPNQGYYSDQIPGGSYTQTCQNIRVSGNTLYATCLMMNSSEWRDTALTNFDRCVGEITNFNGELQCR